MGIRCESASTAVIFALTPRGGLIYLTHALGLSLILLCLDRCRGQTCV